MYIGALKVMGKSFTKKPFIMSVNNDQSRLTDQLEVLSPGPTVECVLSKMYLLNIRILTEL